MKPWQHMLKKTIQSEQTATFTKAVIERGKGALEGTMKRGETSECPVVQTLGRQYLTAISVLRK